MQQQITSVMWGTIQSGAEELRAGDPISSWSLWTHQPSDACGGEEGCSAVLCTYCTLFKSASIVSDCQFGGSWTKSGTKTQVQNRKEAMAFDIKGLCRVLRNMV